MTDIELINSERYLKAPTVAQVNQFVKECGVSTHRVELFYGIAVGTIRQVRIGHRLLPCKYWHIFFGDTVRKEQPVRKYKHVTRVATKKISKRIKEDERIKGLM